MLRASLVRIKLWSAGGEILYSDESRLIGMVYPLGDDELLALRNLQADSGISDLTAPENRFEAQFNKLLEVYVGIEGPGGQRLLFEAYFVYDAVADASEAQWRSSRRPHWGRCWCWNWCRSRSRGHWPGGCNASSAMSPGCCSTRWTPPTPNVDG